MWASNVIRSTIAPDSRGSVKVRAHSIGVRGDHDRGAFLAFGEHVEQQFGAAPVQFEAAQLVETQQVDPAVSGDGAGELFVVGGLDELVDEGGGGDVANAVARFGGGDAQPDQQVALPGARVPDQATGCAAPGLDLPSRRRPPYRCCSGGLSELWFGFARSDCGCPTGCPQGADRPPGGTTRRAPLRSIITAQPVHRRASKPVTLRVAVPT
jgi:hypothetical protein